MAERYQDYVWFDANAAEQGICTDMADDAITVFT
jgi:hypothetical protein